MRSTVLILGLCTLANAQWPQFRGPNSDGIATGTPPPIEFGPTKRLLWKQTLPVGHSSPAIWGDRIFVNGYDPASRKLELICLSRGTGAIMWRRAAPATRIEETHLVSNPATASPAVDAERVYTYFGSYGLMAFTHSGDPQWTLPLPVPPTAHGSGASPALAGDLLVLNHDASSGGFLVAVDRRTGKEVWRQPYVQGARRESYSTTTVWHNQVVLHRNRMIEGYEIATGKRLWSLAEPTSGLSTPVVSDDTIYVETWNNWGEDDQRPTLPDFAAMLKKYDKNGDGVLSESEFPNDLMISARPGLEAVPNSQNYLAFQSVDRNRDGAIDESEWNAFLGVLNRSAQDHGLLALKPEGDSAKIVWRENVSIPEVPSPLLYKGRLFLARNGGVITCLDAATGKVIYRGRNGASSPYFASPVAAGGLVYTTSSDGVVTVLDALKDQLTILARNEIGEEVVATPAISDGAIYVRTAGHLYAFGETRAPDVYRVEVETSQGKFTMEVHRDWAPVGADHFYHLVRAGFYTDSRFYRVIANRFAQFGLPGDPKAFLDLRGPIPDDPVKKSNVRGTFAFAMTGPNARTSQIYINTTDQIRQDEQGFAPLGKVVAGMDVVDKLYNGYGESAGGGMRGGKQGRILAEGNSHLDRDFPKLDKLIRAQVKP